MLWQKKVNIKMARLNSVIASVPMFFDQFENIDFNALDQYLNLVGDEKHTQLFYLMAYNSRVNLLNFDEVIILNKKVREAAIRHSIKYTLCTPYKATNREVEKFLQLFEPEPSLYGVSMLFPERIYDDFQSVIDYFSVPAAYGMQVLMHEMKFISGKDGTLQDWDIASLKLIEEHCPVVGIKEDSKNDQLTEASLRELNSDLILAGGGLTQTSRFLDLGPKAWLAGVSLVRPDLARLEHKVVTERDHKAIDFFETKIETPFFELCKNFGWHCVHKTLLGHVHRLPTFERRPMATLNDLQRGQVNLVWDNNIALAIDEFIQKF